MEFETSSGEGILRITLLESRIDAACSIQFKDMMRAVCANAPARVLLDLQHTDFMDSSGLGAVVSTMKFLGDDRQLELAALSPKVAKVFRLTRMDTILRIHTSADTAMERSADVA